MHFRSQRDIFHMLLISYFLALWAIKIPLENTMICGIDTYHETGAKSNSVSAFVASINGNFTKWYSKAIVQNRREGNGSMNSNVKYRIECVQNRMSHYNNTLL